MPKSAATTLAAALAVCVAAPLMLLGVVFMAITGAGPNCGNGAGPAGGPQQVGDRKWTGEQLANAQTITGVTQQQRLPQHAAVLAVSTAIVESDLENLTWGDRDSLGLFQQRPSKGWGSAEQITNPVYATTTFLERLVAIDGWQTLEPGVAQQRVQRSAFPDRYAPQEPLARGLIDQFWTGPDNPLPPEQGDTAQQASYSPSPRCPDQGGANVPVDPAAARAVPPDFQLPTDPRRRAAVSFALAQVGKPYVYGAKGPEAFDCSGLTRAAWAAAGVEVSAGTTNQVHDGHAVASPSQIAPGDLVFIPGSRGSPSTPRHVGVYAGQGLIVNAYDESTGVVVQPLDQWEPEIVSIRRVADPATAPQQGAQ